MRSPASQWRRAKHFLSLAHPLQEFARSQQSLTIINMARSGVAALSLVVLLTAFEFGTFFFYIPRSVFFFTSTFYYCQHYFFIFISFFHFTYLINFCDESSRNFSIIWTKKTIIRYLNIGCGWSKQNLNLKLI